MSHSTKIIGFNPYKKYQVRHVLGPCYTETLEHLNKLLQDTSMVPGLPPFPSFQEFTTAVPIIISKGRARQFDEDFRQALWVAPGYPVSMIKTSSVDPDLPETRKAGTAHDPLTPQPTPDTDDDDDDIDDDDKVSDDDDVDAILDKLESRTQKINVRLQQPQVKAIGVGSWLAIIQLLIKLGQLAF
jgi:hypothetical protein